MKSEFSRMNIEIILKKTAILLSFFCCFLMMTPTGFAQSIVIDSGMSPNQTVWAFDRDARDADKKVTFWYRIQKEGIYKYNFRAQVFRPDGSEVWNTSYGFDIEGYADQKLTFPFFFYAESPNKLAPAFGVWKVRTAVYEKESKREVSVKEYSITVTDGKKQARSSEVSLPGKGGNPFPVPSFQYKQWKLKSWGIGIYDEGYVGPHHDKTISAIDVRDTFSVKEVLNAWGKGHKFGAMMEGPPLSTYLNSSQLPQYVFGYILKHPDGDNNGLNPRYRLSSYCNNAGAVLFTFDIRKLGRYRIEFLLRERDKPDWEESSWVPIGGFDFTLTE